MDFFDEFPAMGRTGLRDMKKAIDASFKGFSREYGEALEAFFYPLLKFMVWFEKLLIATPWPIILLVIGALAWVGSRNIKLVIGSVAAFIVIGYFGMWKIQWQQWPLFQWQRLFVSVSAFRLVS